MCVADISDVRFSHLENQRTKQVSPALQVQCCPLVRSAFCPIKIVLTHRLTIVIIFNISTLCALSAQFALNDLA